MTEGLVRYERDPRLRTRAMTPALIAYVVEKIVKGVAPRQVIVFGSRARGTAAEGSDLDLLVVNDGPLSNREARRAIERLLYAYL